MQAWAGFAQALSVLVAAALASRTFKSWRQQKVEERRITNAEQIGALTYRLRRAFTLIRRRGFSPQELEIAATKLMDSGLDLAKCSKAKRDRIVQSQVALNRLDTFASDWDDLARLQPLAHALFGKQLAQYLGDLSTEKVRIETAAEHYPVSSDKQLVSEIEATLSQPGNTKTDEFGCRIENTIQSIESILLPIIRHDVQIKS